jgi:ribosomal protein S27E
MEESKKEKKAKYSRQGKKNRAAGQRFEAKVRASLENMGWVVDKWTNTVDYNREGKTGKVVPAKRKYNPFKKIMILGTGFPDFIAFRTNKGENTESSLMKGFCENCKRESLGFNVTKGFMNCDVCGEKIVSVPFNQTKIIGIEVKSNGYLDEVERGMCRWLIENNIFSEILIAKKGEKRGEIEYINFSSKYKKDFPEQ